MNVTAAVSKHTSRAVWAAATAATGWHTTSCQLSAVSQTQSDQLGQKNATSL